MGSLFEIGYYAALLESAVCMLTATDERKSVLTLMTFYKLQVLFLAGHFSPLRLQGTIQIRITSGAKKQLTTM